ncbi:MAG: hypothetical protein QM479_03715 [Pseudomonadota bacterium]
MGLNKILKQLTGLFDEDSYKKKQINSIRELLKKLRKKAVKLEDQLINEKNKEQAKEIKRNLQVIRAQQKKGQKILKESKI